MKFLHGQFPRGERVKFSIPRPDTGRGLPAGVWGGREDTIRIEMTGAGLKGKGGGKENTRDRDEYMWG